MTTRPLFAILISLLTAALGQAPQSVTQIFDQYLAAVNSGDRARIEAFQRANAPDRPEFVERTLDAFERSGGFDVVAKTVTDPQHMTGTLKDRKHGDYLDFNFSVTGSEPPRFAGLRLTPGAEPGAGPEPLNQALEELDQQAANAQFSGAVLVARDGKVIFQKASGLADRERNKANTIDTLFRIGSMNKMFTAVAALQLVGQRKLDLDATVGRYLPRYPNREIADKVKIRYLLSHQGGTGDIFTPEYEQARLRTKDLNDYIQLFGARGPEFEPGTRWAYSNYGYILLGNVIEAVSRLSYYDYVRRNIFEPAGMRSTGSQPESEHVPNLSTGYLKDGQPNTDTLPWRGTSAGGGYSTVGDLLRFALALEAGKLLDRKLLDQATTKQSADPGAPPYGFGFGLSGSGPEFHYGHNGGAPGMNGELVIYRDRGLIFVALSNTDPPAASALANFFSARVPKLVF